MNSLKRTTIIGLAMALVFALFALPLVKLARNRLKRA